METPGGEAGAARGCAALQQEPGDAGADHHEDRGETGGDADVAKHSQ